MALLQEIWSPRVSDYLRRKFLMRGSFRIQLPGDVQPVVDIDNIELADRFVAQERIANVGSLLGAVAGQFPRIQLELFAGTNSIWENEALYIGTGAQTNVQTRHDSAHIVTNVPILAGDSRDPGYTVPTAGILPAVNADTNAAHSAGVIETIFIVPNGGLLVPHKFVLTPGHTYNVEADSVNVIFAVVFVGRAHIAAPGEL